MKIKNIELHNFRASSKLKLDLLPQLNVFVGVNGAGKSTFLDAIAILLSWLANRIQRTSASGRPFHDTDIRSGQSRGYIRIRMEKENMEDFRWRLVKTSKGSYSNEKSKLGAASRLAKQIQEEYQETGLPIFAYYPVNRSVLDIPLRISKKHEFEQFECYDEALVGAANFRHFFEWFRNREDLENENFRKSKCGQLTLESILDHEDTDYVKPNYEFPDRQLEAVRQTLSVFLPDFSDFSVRRNPLRMVAEKQGKQLRIEQLSDGEKNLIALVGDLARRFAIANPSKDKPQYGKGIVLIDEIDLHLHPSWQRMIIPKLQETFPNCQFIISTHSPQVLSHVKPENIFLLNNTTGKISVSKPTESYGKNTDRILEDIMGVDARPPKEKEMLHNLFVEIQKGNLEEARKMSNELHNLIGEDSELVKAGVLIKRKEIIGK